MIRTCSGCKALDTVPYAKCMLDQKIVVTKMVAGSIAVSWKPESGECEKPKTNDAFCTLITMKNQARNEMNGAH